MSLLVQFRHALLWLRSLTHEVQRKRSLRFLLLLAVIAVISSGFLFYLIDPNIHSPWAGMWYAWVTMTHVGYGDIVVASFLGRVLASLLILAGVGFYALATAIFAAVLVAHEMRGVAREVDAVEQDMTQVESAETHILLLLQAMERRLNAIEAQLNKSQETAGRQPDKGSATS